MKADPRAIGDTLAALYREIHGNAMRGLPICNDALAVEAIGFRDFEDHVLGMILTPWFCNLVVVARSEEANLSGAQMRLRFPAGEVDFDVSELEGFGLLASCSLFSPMSEFADHEAARETAFAVLQALFDPNLQKAPSAETAKRRGLDRRALFGFERREEPNRDIAS